MSYVNVYEVLEVSDTSYTTTGVTNDEPPAPLPSPPYPPKRYSPSLTYVWRVRGWNGDGICHSRVYQRRAAALRNYRQAEAYYDRVTLERATVDHFVEVEVQPWQR